MDEEIFESALISSIPKEKQQEYSQKIDQSNNSKGLATLEYFEQQELKNSIDVTEKSTKNNKDFDLDF